VHRPWLLPALVVALALAAGLAASGGSARGGDASTGAAPVPSLEPEATAALWRQLVEAPRPRARAAAACRPLRAVFYAASDWLRLATKLAATASPCADYYVSIPPIVADKTQPRPDQAWRIRALGPRFHALAEIHYATWSRWVASTGNGWHAAGVTARERMAAAGYDVAAGDSWALNEVGSAVRRGEGTARADLREFVRGLYEGGARPARGAVFVIGLGQRTPDLSVYQTTVQGWLTDTAFWTDMAAYVVDWSQEVYGDVRSWAVTGATNDVRREYLNDFLQHPLVLAGAGPAEIEPARAYLRGAYSPLANAAWERDVGYGWTMVAPEQMQAYVSAQVHALRHFPATTGQGQDRFGLAWAPRNASGVPQAEFASRTGALLDRLGAAIRDSADPVVPEDPGSAACGPPGQNVWCTGDLPDARPAEAWRSFRAWSQPLLLFTTAPQTIAAGMPSAPMGLALVSSTGAPAPPRAPLVVTLSSSSPTGTFATSPAGPWAPTLTATIPPGASTVEGVYYLDTAAGSHTLAAAAPGVTSATQTVTVDPGPVERVSVAPSAGSVRSRGSRRFSAIATDAFGNAVASTVAWRVLPSVLGAIEPGDGGSATFTAARVVRTGRVVAVVAVEGGMRSAAATVTVVPATLRVAPLAKRTTRAGAIVTATALDGARRPVPGTVLRLAVRRDGAAPASARVATGPAGRAALRVSLRPGTCAVTSVVRASAPGFRWDGRVRRVRVCR
jgi:hypothetical protein